METTYPHNSFITGTRCLGYLLLVFLTSFGLAHAEVVEAVSLADFVSDNGSETMASDLQSAVDFYDHVDVEPCLGQLRQAARSYPSLPKPEIMLAVLHCQAGHLQDARTTLDLVAGESSRDPTFLFTLAQINAREKRCVESLVLIEHAMKIIEELTWPEEQKQKFVRSCKQEKVTLYELIGDWQQSADLLESLIDEETAQPKLSHRLAKCYYKTDRVDDAIAELSKNSDALKSETENADTKTDTENGESGLGDKHKQIPELIVAQWYAEDGDSAKAEEMFRRATANQHDPSMKLVLANYILDQGRIPDAKSIIEELPELTGENAARKKQVEARIATCLGQYAEAAKLLEELYRGDPSNIEMANQFARAMLVSDSPTSTAVGVDIATAKAIQNPDRFLSRETLGWAQVVAGQSRKAEQTLLEIAAVRPLSADTAYFTARALANNGKRSLARQLVDRALDTVGPFDLRLHANSWVKSEFDSKSEPTVDQDSESVVTVNEPIIDEQGQ